MCLQPKVAELRDLLDRWLSGENATKTWLDTAHPARAWTNGMAF